MTLAAPINLSDWFETSVEDFLNISPTSVSPQPVHVLNGFFHHSLSGKRSPRAAIDFVATRQGGGWAVSNNDLRAKSPLALPSDDGKLDQARRAVAALIAADRAVFMGFASFQLAHLGLTTSDRTHFRIGELAAKLVFESERGAELLSALVERLSAPEPNPHWAIESVLAEPGAVAGFIPEAPPASNWWARDERCSALAQNLTDLLVRALRLSSESRDSLVGLEVLATTATWVALVAYAQVPGLVTGRGSVTLLAEAGEPGLLPSVRASSAEVVNVIDARFREFLSQRIRDEIAGRHGERPMSDDEALGYVAQCPVKKLSGGAELTDDQIREIFLSWRQEHDWATALALTLQESLTSAMGNKSRDWYSAVGRHCGFVGPRRGHPARLRAEVSLVPTLVLAGLDDQDGPVLPYAVWAQRLAERFGVVFGPSQEARSMPTRASEVELELNQGHMQALLASLGLGRRYSDGVTEVLNPLFAWGARK